MTDNSVVRARIDERTKKEAAAVLKTIGLTVSDAFRLLLVRVAAEKALPFEPLVPNAETVEAMKAARRGELDQGRQAGQTAREPECGRLDTPPAFERDYKREKSGRHGKKLDALLMEVVNLLAADTPLPRRNVDHPLVRRMERLPRLPRAARSHSHLPQAGRRRALSSCGSARTANWVSDPASGLS